jgi:hypothetical protein
MSTEKPQTIEPLPRATAEAIEAERAKLFRAMALVEVTERALDSEEQRSERDLLEMAYEILDGVAAALNVISGIDSLPEPEEGEPS